MPELPYLVKVLLHGLLSRSHRSFKLLPLAGGGFFGEAK